MNRYASRTGTKRNLAALRKAGWRLIISARGVLRNEGFAYAYDCGSWTAYQEWLKGIRSENMLDIAAFERGLIKVGAGADWIVLPDVITEGEKSLNLSVLWLRKLRRRKAFKNANFMLAVQEGMESGALLKRVRRIICPKVGIFIGGEVEWKLRHAVMWSNLAHARGAKCHMGRVNTARRAKLCDIAGIDSFDGSGPSRYEDALRQVEAGLNQLDLEGYIRRNSCSLPA